MNLDMTTFSEYRKKVEYEIQQAKKKLFKQTPEQQLYIYDMNFTESFLLQKQLNKEHPIYKFQMVRLKKDKKFSYISINKKKTFDEKINKKHEDHKVNFFHDKLNVQQVVSTNNMSFDDKFYCYMKIRLLLEQEVSKLFIYEPNIIFLKMENYHQKFSQKRGMSISKIAKKLFGDIYCSIQQFEYDLQLIVRNASYFYQLENREMLKASIEFQQSLFKINQKMKDYMKTYKNYKQTIQDLKKQKRNECKSQSRIKKLSQNQMMNLMQKYNKLPKQRQIDIVKLLKKSMPNLSKKIQINSLPLQQQLKYRDCVNTYWDQINQVEHKQISFQEAFKEVDYYNFDSDSM